MTISNRINNVYNYFGTKKGLQLLSSVVLGLVLVSAGFAGYHWYSLHRTQQAHTIFAQCMQEFERALSSDDASLWTDVERAFATGYKSYPRTAIAPYFLAFQAEALIHQDKQEEARVLFADAVKKISKSSPLYYLYATKLALMNMDTQLLTKLADDHKNSYRDMALYYLGYCAFVANDRDTAEKTWARLVREQGNSSVWANLAQAKLEYSA